MFQLPQEVVEAFQCPHCRCLFLITQDKIGYKSYLLSSLQEGRNVLDTLYSNPANNFPAHRYATIASMLEHSGLPERLSRDQKEAVKNQHVTDPEIFQARILRLIELVLAEQASKRGRPN